MIQTLKHQKIVNSYIEKLILPSRPEAPLWNRESIIYGKPARWNYIDGCMIKALLMLYYCCGDDRLLDFSVGFTDFYVTENGDIPTLNPLDYNLDNINGCKNLLTLYKLTGMKKYMAAAEKTVNTQLAGQPRLRCGSFTHKAIYPSQIWLDGAYMVLPFMTEYASMTGDTDMTEDVLMQLQNIRRIMLDSETGLYYHGYNESGEQQWADPATGLSGEFWLRAMGWLCAGLADICELSDENGELFRFSRDMLTELLDSLSSCITDGDMLLQLPARSELSGNYPETSGTLLTAYSALKACRLGIGSEKTKTDGMRLLAAVFSKYISYENEIPVLGNICLMAGLGGSQQRSGTAEYYLSEKIVSNDAKGIAPLLMACSEICRI